MTLGGGVVFLNLSQTSSLPPSYSNILFGDNHPSADSWRHQVGGADNCATKQ